MPKSSVKSFKLRKKLQPDNKTWNGKLLWYQISHLFSVCDMHINNRKGIYLVVPEPGYQKRNEEAIFDMKSCGKTSFSWIKSRPEIMSEKDKTLHLFLLTKVSLSYQQNLQYYAFLRRSRCIQIKSCRKPSLLIHSVQDMNGS